MTTNNTIPSLTNQLPSSPPNQSLAPSPFQPLELDEPPALKDLIAQHEQGKRDFRGLDFAQLDLSGLDLSHCDLRNANFFKAELRCTNLAGADLRGANFKNANLRGASLKDADFTGANLTDSDFCHTCLDGANLTDATLVRVRCHRTSLTRVTLPDETKWLFKAFVTGEQLSKEDLLLYYQQCRQRRKRLAQVGLLVLIYLGFEVAQFSLPFVFSLM